MAARRKSLKPTNKIHHRIQVDDDVYEDMEEPTMPGVSTTKQTLVRGTSHSPQDCSGTTVSRPTVFNTQSLSGQFMNQSKSTEPHIALPSDIYQDFEALKSATNMDTTELMRKLLTDFHKVTSSSHQSPDRKLDDVINDLFATRSSNALDLSKRKRVDTSSCNYDPGDSPLAILGHGYTDDQLAMGMLDTSETVDDNSDIKPLDLTLQKNQSDSASGNDLIVKRKSTSSFCPSVLKFSSTSKEDSHFSQAFKHAGPYVINLEPGNEGPQLVNSSLAQVLRMDIPLNSFSSGNKCLTGSQESLFLTEGANNSSNCKSNFRSKLFQNDTDTSTMFQKGNNEASPCDSILSCLPTYAEAVTSVINAQHSKRATGGILSEPTDGVQEITKAKPETRSSGISFVHINTDDTDIKMFPLNLNTQLLSTANSSEAHQKPQHNLLHQLLQHQLKSDNKSPQRQFQNVPITQAQLHQNAITTFCGGPISNVQMMQVPATLKSDLMDVQGLTEAIKSNDIPYPNFLLESHSVGLPTIQTALSNVAIAPSTLPNTSMPMSTLFMTTSTNGGVGQMVAIPVIHAVSDGITGLQPFAFAPHAIPLPNNVTSKAARCSDDTNIPSQPPLPGHASNSIKILGEQHNPEFSSSDSFTLEAKKSPSLETIKPKPGRPRGRGGRGQSQKAPNKDMKLLTENTLFPGVYTSILKLPWSRRSRNKSKTKTIHELKKQAQIIAHSRVNEGDSNYNGNVEFKEECLEEDNISVDKVEQARSENKTEKLIESQQREQDLLDNNQMHQIQHQKLKDIEQQQRLHMQYHLRLQEEQQKLTKQIEQSYLNLSSGSPVQTPFAASGEQASSDKQENHGPDTLQRESSDLTMSVGAIVPIDSLTFTPTILSQDPVMMVYSNPDTSTPKKTPRKRGRPPKVPNISSKTTDGHPSLANTLLKYEPDNFLHTNISSPDCLTTSTDTNPQSNLSVFHKHMLVPEKFASVSGTNIDDREITLESKINFLTSKIELELSQNMLAQASSASTMCLTQTIKSENESGNTDDGTMYQEMKMAINKSLVDVKPRRKKVSRLLKSDENFMYATFKIKPKGLTPRKSRKRRKDVVVNTVAVAETLSNLRQKALRECVASRADVDVTRPPSMVAWKFHEQYPCSNEEDESKDRKAVCVKCGKYLTPECDDAVSRECEACMTEQGEFSTDIDHHQSARSKAEKTNLNDAEMKAECCITCGDVFQKHFSDPSARCDVCQSNAPRVIQSSKLFSLQDYRTDSPPVTLKPSSTTTSFMSAPDILLKDRKYSDKGFAKINNNHLFCSVCRMEFTKICDYLGHIRDTHDTKLEETTPVLSYASDQSRKIKVSKTKKSLSHKTLTCPVEECPHFFREQKDLDLHFMKKHSNLNICFHGNSYTHAEGQDNTTQLNHCNLTIMTGNEASLELAHDTGSSGQQETLTSHEQVGPAVSTCEKPLQCEFCSYRCRQKNALTWHMRKHPEAASQYRKYSNLNVD